MGLVKDLSLLRKLWGARGTLKKLWGALSGWKVQIAWVATLVVRVYDAMNGTNHADGLVAILGPLGGEAVAATNWPMLVADVVGVIGTGHKLLKAYKQYRAGAKFMDLLSGAGYVREEAKKAGILGLDVGRPALTTGGGSA